MNHFGLNYLHNPEPFIFVRGLFLFWTTARVNTSAGSLTRHLPQRLAELEEKEHGRKAHGEEIRHRLCEINGRRRVRRKEMRQRVDQRNQQNELAHYGDKDGGLRFAERGKRHLACHLDAEEHRTRHIDAQSRAREFEQRRI